MGYYFKCGFVAKVSPENGIIARYPYPDSYRDPKGGLVFCSKMIPGK